jgi:transcriptional regulator with XRE-family HTH domain
MKNVVSTIPCYECGKQMDGSKGEYKYIECGLTSVFLKDIVVFRCTNCNAVVPEIPAAGVLHRIIALRILAKQNFLTGSEIRFLRKLCGFSVNEFAEILGSSKSVISRWEKDGCGKTTDRLIRLLVVAKLVREAADQGEPILTNVTFQNLAALVEEAFKVLEGKGKKNERYEISPDDIARYSVPIEQPMELAVAVQ